MNFFSIANVIVLIFSALTMVACFSLPSGLLESEIQARVFLYALAAFGICSTIGAVVASMLDSVIENNF